MGGTLADVLIVGAGLAGMRAALAAEEAGAGVRLIDRGPIGLGTNSALSNAAFSGPVSSERAEEYVALVREIGRELNRTSYVRQIAAGAPAAIGFLEGLGLDLATRPGLWSVRAPQAETIPGTALVQRVVQRVAAGPRIGVERGVRVTGLLTAGGRVLGAQGIGRDGGARLLRAGAVVLACGGAGAIYARHDNQASILGQGYHLAARAGLDLWDMEFVQFYPLVLDEPGWPVMMVYPPYPREARLLGPSGADLLERHGLGSLPKAIMQQRDAFSALLVREAEGGPVRLDLRGVPEDAWETPPLRLLGRLRGECRRRPIRVAPAVHFCMGGVRTDEAGQTALPGLFACGEMVWGLHGANRLGGNALMECLVSGAIAGRSAAQCARTAGGAEAPPALPPPLDQRAGEAVDLRALRAELQEIAWRSAGVVRSAAGMAQGLAQATKLGDALAAARAASPSEVVRREDLRGAVLVLRAILTAGLGRQESRGTFLRSDHPLQDDTRWRKNSRVSWDPASDRLAVAYSPAE